MTMVLARTAVLSRLTRPEIALVYSCAETKGQEVFNC
jgi:hypothetical protein